MGVIGLRPTKYRRHIEYNKLKDPVGRDFKLGEWAKEGNRKNSTKETH